MREGGTDETQWDNTHNSSRNLRASSTWLKYRDFLGYYEGSGYVYVR